MDLTTLTWRVEDGVGWVNLNRPDRYNAFDTGIFLATPMLIEAIEAKAAAGGVGSISEGMQALAERLDQPIDFGLVIAVDVDVVVVAAAGLRAGGTSCPGTGGQCGASGGGNHGR